MRFVVDSNVLFTFFWKDSVFHEIQNTIMMELYSPEYALEEINKYSSDIIKKANISKKEFKDLKTKLISKVTFMPLGDYSGFIKNVKDRIKESSESEKNEIFKDIDFITLAYKLNLPIWSNDKLLKKQQITEVFSTEEIIKLIS